jgi:hypothetical protein
MTMIIVILLGIGALLVSSAIEDKSILESFQDIISGKGTSA